MAVRAIRGAITAENSGESIIENTKVLLNEIFAANGLAIEQVISVLFTCTKDLNAAYPAGAAREMGMVNTALMCAAEMDVPGGLEKCIRVQVLADGDASQGQVKHIYLKEARALRPDLLK